MIIKVGHIISNTMSQHIHRGKEESDSDPEIDFDSAWKNKFGEEAQTHSTDSPVNAHFNNPPVNEDGYDNGTVDFENDEPDGKKQAIQVTQNPDNVKIKLSKMLPSLKGSSNFSFGTNVNSAGDIEEIHTSSSYSLQCCSFENPKRAGILTTLSVLIVVTIIVLKVTGVLDQMFS